MTVDTQDEKRAAVGRGGVGNIQSRSRALANSKIPENRPHAASVITEFAAHRAQQERTIVQVSQDSSKAVQKSGRGGSGNFLKAKKAKKARQSTSPQLASDPVHADDVSLSPDDFESLRLSPDAESRTSLDTLRHPDGVEAFGRGDLRNIRAARSKSCETLLKNRNSLTKLLYKIGRGSRGSQADTRVEAETETISGVEREWLGVRRADVISKRQMYAARRDEVILIGFNESSHTLGEPFPISPNTSSLSIITDTFATNSSTLTVSSLLSPSDTSASGTSPSDVDLTSPSNRSLPHIVYLRSSGSTSDASSSRSRSFSTSSSGSTSSLAYLQDMLSDYSGDDHLGDSNSHKSLTGSVSVHSLPTVHETIFEENENVYVSFIDFEE